MPLPARPFYYIRHGETAANRDCIMSGGGLDVPLNATGEDQARSAARHLAGGALPRPSALFCSPLQRARRTADILGEALGLSPVVIDDLAEWYVGRWEGLPWRDCPDPFAWDADPEDGETREGFAARVQNGLTRALDLAGDVATATGAPPLIVAHGAVWKAAQTLLSLTGGQIANCALIELSPDPWRYRALTAPEDALA